MYGNDLIKGKKLKQLLVCFGTAVSEQANYVAVKIEGIGEEPEIVINSNCNISEKAYYYIKAYNENLELRANPNIKIVDYVFGDSFEEIQEKFNSRKVDE